MQRTVPGESFSPDAGDVSAVASVAPFQVTRPADLLPFPQPVAADEPAVVATIKVLFKNYVKKDRLQIDNTSFGTASGDVNAAGLTGSFIELNFASLDSNDQVNTLMAETKITAELAGRVFLINVGIGDKVTSGQDVAIVEAMKMEIPVAAPVSGIVRSIAVAVEDMIEEGQLLVTLDT
ncbi:biotin/lipoyl-containing protein [Bradyrhizobium prioriisuperbiae]|uniref:biotin/lipoyl-containing protein n=1 Tax=Bradyrhizobium prioriisuperbiae TaxID=2854389 RepID=UPI0028EBC4CC|nr:biotin/lipoyl-containing protein [Bradyrhizobium prioritasuperba]